MTTARIRRRPDVLWRQSLDATILLPVGAGAVGAGEVVTLAGTGPAVWELLAEWRTVDDLVEILAGTFGATPEVVRGDLEPLLGQLEAQGVLQTAADSGDRQPD